MTAFRILKWISFIIIAPWLIFMLTAVFMGGEPITKMGEVVVSSVQSLTLKLSSKADSVKRQSDEWKEKITGKKAGEEKPVVQEKPQDKTFKKKSKRAMRVEAE